jgi:hypothetical protein
VAATHCHCGSDSFDTCLPLLYDPEYFQSFSGGSHLANVLHFFLSSGSSRTALRTRNMSALLETTSVPGVYSLAEIRTHLHSEIESCERFAHKVVVITVSSTGMGFATAKRFVRKGVDQRVHNGPAKGPWIWRSLRSARRQRESRAMSPAKVIWTAFTNRSKHMVEKSTWSSRNAGITQLAPFGMRVLTQRLLRSIRGGPYEHR